VPVGKQSGSTRGGIEVELIQSLRASGGQEGNDNTLQKATGQENTQTQTQTYIDRAVGANE